jgi:RNA polymerase sigma-70 factor (ECF subfamily)
MDARNCWSEREAGRASAPVDACPGTRSNYMRGPDVANDRDRTLLTAIAAGDETALREIHSRYYRRVASFSWRITGRYDLAEEVTNDTLRVIWQCAPRFKGASKVSTWILGIAYRLSLTTLRTMARRWPRAEPLHDPIEDKHEPGAEAEVCEWVGSALALLPKQQRTVLELFYGLGHSCNEIADRERCPVGTVKTRMYQGRRKLRQLLPRLAGPGNA